MLWLAERDCVYASEVNCHIRLNLVLWKKGIIDAAENETPCTTCNGDGEVFKRGGTVDEFTDFLVPERTHHIRLHTGARG